MKYRSIVFAQGDDATEPLGILEDKGELAAIKYLLQWDYGEGDIEDKPHHGTADHIKKWKGYILSWNTHIGYIGLEDTIQH